MIVSTVRIAPIAYRGRGGRSLLLCAGTGLMLSLMDACPRLAACLDADGLAAGELARLAPWLMWRSLSLDLIVVAGWYAATDPAPLAAAVERARGFGRADVLCYVQCHGARDPFVALRTAGDLEALIAQANAFPKKTRPDFADGGVIEARPSGYLVGESVF
jgi:hypothetical protein